MIIGCFVFLLAVAVGLAFGEETKTGKKIMEGAFKIIDSVCKKIVE